MGVFFSFFCYFAIWSISTILSVRFFSTQHNGRYQHSVSKIFFNMQLSYLLNTAEWLILTILRNNKYKDESGFSPFVAGAAP